MIDFLIAHKPVFVILHALSAAIGLGSVIVTDTLFFRFLKDFKISAKEDETLRAISSVVWVVIGLLFVTGLALFLTTPAEYLAKSKFVAKLVIFAIIVLNGFALNWLITPYLRKISFGPVTVEPTRHLRLMRRIAFASGGVSFVSWFSVFVLGSLRSIPGTAGQALAVYTVVALLAVVGSQVYASWMKRHSVFGISFKRGE